MIKNKKKPIRRIDRKGAVITMIICGSLFSFSSLVAQAEALDAGNFTIKAEMDNHYAERGGGTKRSVAGDPGGGGGSGTSPEPAPPVGDFVFRIDMNAPGCTTSALYFDDAIGTITNPRLVEAPLQEGRNVVNMSGIWTVKGSFDRVSTGLAKGLSYDVGTSSNSTEGDCLTAVTKWENTGTTSLEAAFAGTDNLASVVSPPETVTSYRAAFFESKFNGLLSNWKTANVERIDDMFNGATEFNQIINTWDTSSVTNMYRAFYRAESFTGQLNRWNVSNVTNMSNMFANSNFNSVLSAWDTSNVENMAGMFASSTFNRTINNWNVESVKDMEYMFSYSSYSQPLNDWDVSNVTNMLAMFQGAINFNSPLDKWETHNVRDFDKMFYYSKAFNQNLSSWNVSKSYINPAALFNSQSVLSSSNLPNAWK